MPRVSQKEMVFTVSDENGLLVMIRKDQTTRKNLVYECKEMEDESIAELMGEDCA